MSDPKPNRERTNKKGGLTDAALRVMKAGAKPYKRGDMDGLHVLVTKAGGRLWRWTFRLDGRQDTLSYGRYPDLPLAAARQKHEEARRLVAQGIHPRRYWEEQEAKRLAEQEERAAATFKVLAEAVMANKGNVRPATREQWRHNLARLATLHDKPVTEITKRDLKAAFERLKDTPVAAARSRALVRDVFGMAEDFELPVINVDRILRSAVAKKPDTKHNAAITDRDGFGALLRAIDGYPNRLIGRALRFVALSACRSIECRFLEWSDVDFNAGTITIPAERMKMARNHIIPMSRQLTALLREQQAEVGKGRYVFVAAPKAKKPLAKSTLYEALTALGYGAGRHTPHGFRSVFSTHANDAASWSSDAIELSLAHSDENATRAAYNRAERIDERAKLMQWWANECDRMRSKMSVVFDRSGAEASA